MLKYRAVRFDFLRQWASRLKNCGSRISLRKSIGVARGPIGSNRLKAGSA